MNATLSHPPGLIDAERRYLVAWGNREIIAVLAASGILCAAIAALAAFHSLFWLILLAPIIPLAALGLLFFRNPSRRIPAGADLLLAAADGKVVEVGRVEDAEYIGGPAWKVAIFLSIFSVHLNRAPCSGRIEYVRHRDGKHLDARNPSCGTENESQAIGLRRTESMSNNRTAAVVRRPSGAEAGEVACRDRGYPAWLASASMLGGGGSASPTNKEAQSLGNSCSGSEPGSPEGLKVLVRQVSGAIARRIVCPLREGQDVERGRLLGMIKFGSRTEIFVAARPGDPPVDVLVRVGDTVRAGETVVARLGVGA